MGLLDKITASGAKVAEKAKEVGEIATLTASIEKEKVLMEKVFNEIGKKMYAEHKEELAAMFPEEMAKLDESSKKIEESREAVKNKKGTTACPGCGKAVDKGTKFCPACGAVIAEAEDETEESVSSDNNEF